MKGKTLKNRKEFLEKEKGKEHQKGKEKKIRVVGGSKRTSGELCCQEPKYNSPKCRENKGKSSKTGKWPQHRDWPQIEKMDHKAGDKMPKDNVSISMQCIACTGHLSLPRWPLHFSALCPQRVLLFGAQ